MTNRCKPGAAAFVPAKGSREIGQAAAFFAVRNFVAPPQYETFALSPVI
jgi:hypothetical protein